jgi:hypothetical protein
MSRRARQREAAEEAKWIAWADTPEEDEDEAEEYEIEECGDE